MADQYVLSYDLGTSGVKAALVDLGGTLCGLATERYSLMTPRESWAEQNPEDYWNAIVAATGRVMRETGADPADVLGMAFCSQWKAIIPFDEKGERLANAIIWLDARADEQARKLNRVLQVNYFKEKLLGFKPSSKLNAALGRDILCGADYWPKLMWLREEQPEVYAQTSMILECNSYVKWRATGEMAVDMTNHFTRSFNKGTQGFYDLILKLAKVDGGKFPQLVLPTDRVGGLTDAAAAELGLLAGTPVFGGCGDIPAIAIGSGSAQPGGTHAYFGSSGWLSSRVRCDEGFLSTSPFDREHDLLMFGLQAIGLAFDWALRQFYHAEHKRMGDGVYDMIEQELADIPAGSDGLLATHWMFGERPPFFSDRARGVFVNINNTHDRRHMMNAVQESVCYSMRMAFDALENGTRRRVPFVNAVGGCAKSAHWMQTLADVLGVPVNVPQNPRHAGAVGTAYCALIGLGFCRDWSEAQSRIAVETTYLPRAETKQAHERNYQAYRALHGALQDTFAKLK